MCLNAHAYTHIQPTHECISVCSVCDFQIDASWLLYGYPNHSIPLTYNATYFPLLLSNLQLLHIFVTIDWNGVHKFVWNHPINLLTFHWEQKRKSRAQCTSNLQHCKQLLLTNGNNKYSILLQLERFQWLILSGKHCDKPLQTIDEQMKV